MVVILRSGPFIRTNGNIMNSLEDRNESNHEYNFFLDKEIQKKLLAYAEEEEHVDRQRIDSASARGRGAAKSALCSWNPETSFRLRKPEKIQTKNVQKDVPRWDPNRPPKEITYLFKHYSDTRKYMDQYRLEHTYNFGPLGKDAMTVEIHTSKAASAPPALPDPNLKQPPPRVKSYLDFSHSNSSNTQTPKVPSEPNILELAHKYKIAPNILRAAQEQQQNDTDLETQSLTRSRTGSAHSQNGLSRRKSGKTVSIQPTKVPAIPLSHNGTGGGSAKSSRKNSPVNSGAAFFQGKTMKHIPSNGYAIDSQAVSPAVTNPKSPRSVVQVTDGSLKTVDLLSHNVTALDSKGYQESALQDRKQDARKQEGTETLHSSEVPEPSSQLNNINEVDSYAMVTVEMKITPSVHYKDEPLSSRTGISSISYSHVSETDGREPFQLNHTVGKDSRLSTVNENDRLLMNNTDIETEIAEVCYTPLPDPVKHTALGNSLSSIKNELDEAKEGNQPNSISSSVLANVTADTPDTCMKNDTSITDDKTSIIPKTVSIGFSYDQVPESLPSLRLLNSQLVDDFAHRGREYVNSVKRTRTKITFEANKSNSADIRSKTNSTQTKSESTIKKNSNDPKEPTQVSIVSLRGFEMQDFLSKEVISQSIDNFDKTPGKEVYLAESNGNGKTENTCLKKQKNDPKKVVFEGPNIVDLSNGALPAEEPNTASYPKVRSIGSNYLPQNNVKKERTEILQKYLSQVVEFEKDQPGNDRLQSATEKVFRAPSTAIAHEKDRQIMKTSGLLRAAGLSFDPFSKNKAKLLSVSAGAGRKPELVWKKNPKGSKRSKALYGKKDFYHKSLQNTLSDPKVVKAKAEFINVASSQQKQSGEPGNQPVAVEEVDAMRAGFSVFSEPMQDKNQVTKAQLEAQHLPAATCAFPMDGSSWREKLQALSQLPKPSNRGPSRRQNRSRSVEDMVRIFQSGKDQYSDPKNQFVPKNAVKLHFVRALNADVSNTRSHPESVQKKVVPECLDTSSDFFNPSVSADDRFEKYLIEMKNRESLSGNSQMGEAASTPRKELRSARSPKRLDSKYMPGTKGGGWKVIPGIRDETKDVFENRIPVSSVSSDSWSDTNSNNEDMLPHTHR